MKKYLRSPNKYINCEKVIIGVFATLLLSDVGLFVFYRLCLLLMHILCVLLAIFFIRLNSIAFFRLFVLCSLLGLHFSLFGWLISVFLGSLTYHLLGCFLIFLWLFSLWLLLWGLFLMIVIDFGLVVVILLMLHRAVLTFYRLLFFNFF